MRLRGSSRRQARATVNWSLLRLKRQGAVAADGSQVLGVRSAPTRPEEGADAVVGRIAQLCRGLFAMPVLAYDPYLTAATCAERGAEKVALDGYRAVMEGRTLAISGVHNWAVAQSTRFAPRKLVTAISRWVAEKVE